MVERVGTPKGQSPFPLLQPSICTLVVLEIPEKLAEGLMAVEVEIHIMGAVAVLIFVLEPTVYMPVLLLLAVVEAMVAQPRLAVTVVAHRDKPPQMDMVQGAALEQLLPEVLVAEPLVLVEQELMRVAAMVEEEVAAGTEVAVLPPMAPVTMTRGVAVVLDMFIHLALPQITLLAAF
nr:MAG TPA: hypothetical protein [Caudoviricetes sp.]